MITVKQELDAVQPLHLRLKDISYRSLHTLNRELAMVNQEELAVIKPDGIKISGHVYLWLSTLAYLSHFSW